MERGLLTLAAALRFIGVAVACFGLYLIGFALFTPAQPPPSMNEGHALAWVVGLMITTAGLLAFSIGLAIRWGLKNGGVAGGTEVMNLPEPEPPRPLYTGSELVEQQTSPSGVWLTAIYKRNDGLFDVAIYGKTVEEDPPYIPPFYNWQVADSTRTDTLESARRLADEFLHRLARAEFDSP
jgi:hypothetical protein